LAFVPVYFILFLMNQLNNNTLKNIFFKISHFERIKKWRCTLIFWCSAIPKPLQRMPVALTRLPVHLKLRKTHPLQPMVERNPEHAQTIFHASAEINA
jgi:hypothetical protein